jgi:hypothetical protein
VNERVAEVRSGREGGLRDQHEKNKEGREGKGERRRKEGVEQKKQKKGPILS